jgi:hypothetical protein
MTGDPFNSYCRRDGFRCEIVQKNLFLLTRRKEPLQITMNKYNFDIQAQRDYFGAHTYELLTAPGHYVHTNWTGTGGNVSASTYSA